MPLSPIQRMPGWFSISLQEQSNVNTITCNSKHLIRNYCYNFKIDRIYVNTVKWNVNIILVKKEELLLWAIHSSLIERTSKFYAISKSTNNIGENIQQIINQYIINYLLLYIRLSESKKVIFKLISSNTGKRNLIDQAMSSANIKIC